MEENRKPNPWKLGVSLFEVVFFFFPYPFGSLNMFKRAGSCNVKFPELAATQAVLEACSSSFQLPMALRILKDMLRLKLNGGLWRAC